MMEWMYGEKYTDLYMVDENGDLVFNADYRNLNTKTYRGDFDSQIMQAVPTIIMFGEKKYEGVHIYVNSTSYCIPLTFQEISSIFGILRNFSFSEEISSVLSCYEYIEKHNSYSTTEWTKKSTPFD